VKTEVVPESFFGRYFCKQFFCGVIGPLNLLKYLIVGIIVGSAQGRKYVWESTRWLVNQAQIDDAQEAVKTLVEPIVQKDFICIALNLQTANSIVITSIAKLVQY